MNNNLQWSYALAFGANVDGRIGSPRETFVWTLRQLEAESIAVLAHSPPIETRPFGGKTRIAYLNAAIVVSCGYAPAELLRRLKRLERRAGRRTLSRNASRPLDLDILIWRGGLVGFSPSGRRFGMVQVPHPELHKRSFMLVPLTQVLPHWWHAGLRVPGLLLTRRLLVKPGDLGANGGACVMTSSVAQDA